MLLGILLYVEFPNDNKRQFNHLSSDFGQKPIKLGDKYSRLMIANMAVNKPSKALNLVNVVFGYYLASTLVSSSSLSLEQKLSVLAISGGVVGALLFYIKPVERLTAFAVILMYGIRIEEPTTVTGKNSHRLTMSTVGIFNSPFFAEERAKINGIVYFAISIILSQPLLVQAGIPIPLAALVFLASILLVIALWEGYSLVSDKLRTGFVYYGFCRTGRSAALALKDAIEKKDWTEAMAITRRSFETNVAFADQNGLCTKCHLIVPKANYCPECGKRLLFECGRCHQILATEGTMDYPKYCRVCGEQTR
jgi:hypothetical protein